MSKVSNCPTCGGKSKIKEKKGATTYQAIQNEEVLKKVEQLKKAMLKFKEKSKTLENKLKELKAK